jgi:hypothetical protein
MTGMIGELLLLVMFFGLGYEFAIITERKRGRSALSNDAETIARARRERKE